MPDQVKPEAPEAPEAPKREPSKRMNGPVEYDERTDKWRTRGYTRESPRNLNDWNFPINRR